MLLLLFLLRKYIRWPKHCNNTAIIMGGASSIIWTGFGLSVTSKLFGDVGCLSASIARHDLFHNIINHISIYFYMILNTSVLIYIYLYCIFLLDSYNLFQISEV